MSDLTKEEWAEVEKYVVPPIVRKLKAVIHVVTPESSSGTLWAEIQRLQAVEAESARTIAHLNQTHREVSEMQQARIEELEKALTYIAKFAESMRKLGTAGLQPTEKP